MLSSTRRTGTHIGGALGRRPGDGSDRRPRQRSSISPTPCPSSFDPFFRVHHQERSQTKGLGLGLRDRQRSSRVARRHHCSAQRVESGDGIYLHDSGCISRASSPAAICHLCAADYWWMTILIFATSCGIVSNRKAFRSRVPQMERPPCECWQTHRWMECSLDIALPEPDGFDVLRQLRPSHPTLPVVVSDDGRGSADRAMAAVEAGAQATC